MIGEHPRMAKEFCEHSQGIIECLKRDQTQSMRRFNEKTHWRIRSSAQGESTSQNTELITHSELRILPSELREGKKETEREN